MTPSPITVEPCTVPAGPQIPTSREPLQIFSEFFTDDIMSLLVTETNRYAAQCLAATSSNGTWETDKDELKAYLGFRVVMGVCKLPEIRDYWSTDPKLNNAFISSRITRQRFEEITRYLHFVDNESLPLPGEPGYHRLQKVMPIVTRVKERCIANYNPNTQNVIDEAMIPFRGLDISLFYAIVYKNVHYHTHYANRPIIHQAVPTNETLQTRYQGVGAG